jgi:hypothetical protein
LEKSIGIGPAGRSYSSAGLAIAKINFNTHFKENENEFRPIVGTYSLPTPGFRDPAFSRLQSSLIVLTRSNAGRLKLFQGIC